MAKIQLRRGTSAQWASANPVLAAGEPGRDTSLKRSKTGDGVTAWASLPWDGLTKGEADNNYAPIGSVDGLPESNDPNIAFAVVDEDDKQSWISVTPTGGIPPHSKAQIADAAAEQLTPAQSTAQGFAVVDQANRMSDLAVDATGRFMPHSVASMSQKQGVYKGPTATPPVGSGEFIHFKTDGNGALLDILSGKA